MVAGRIALWDQASLTESNRLHRLPSKLPRYSQFHPSLPNQFSAVCIMSIDGQTPLELVNRIIADNTGLGLLPPRFPGKLVEHPQLIDLRIGDLSLQLVDP